MKLSRVSNNELQDMFSAAYQNVASENNINEFEAICEKSVDESDVTMEVTIFGFAGTPTQKEYENIKGAKKIILPPINEDDEERKFILDSTYTLNTNDYVAVYKMK